MKIRFNETVFQDYSRVGYDSVSITYTVLNDDDPGSYDIITPAGYTRAQACALASKMARIVSNEGITYTEAYHRLVK